MEGAMAERWKVRPDGANWGDFGPDDMLGRLNLIGPAQVRKAVAEVREGRVFCLSLPLDYPGGNYHDLQRKPPALRPVIRNGRKKYNLHANPNHSDVYSDDHLLLYSQYSTHWDALAHVGSRFDADGDGEPETRYYNGYRAGIDIGPATGADPGQETSAEPRFDGARALGIENMAAHGVQGRGVMLDLFTAFGADRRIVGYDDVMRVCGDDGVEVEPGDILCIHTGHTAAILKADKQPSTALLEDGFCHLDGTDARLLRWIDDSGIAAIAADNYAVEAVPPRSAAIGKAYEGLHEHCLFKLGIHLGELWYLAELNAWLRAHRRTRFLLTAPPLRLPGAVGSPVTPIATV
jgi:kynurenine formamidase